MLLNSDPIGMSERRLDCRRIPVLVAARYQLGRESESRKSRMGMELNLSGKEDE